MAYGNANRKTTEKTRSDVKGGVLCLFAVNDSVVEPRTVVVGTECGK